jgi:hypothetical protein
MSSTGAETRPYEIRVRGALGGPWSDWLDGVTLSGETGPPGPGITVLTGRFDQAALRGLLTRLWDLNLTVLSVGPPSGGVRPE